MDRRLAAACFKSQPVRGLLAAKLAQSGEISRPALAANVGTVLHDKRQEFVKVSEFCALIINHCVCRQLLRF